MFVSNCLNTRGDVNADRADALFGTHPLLLSAAIENYWNAAPHRFREPFGGWPQALTDPIEQAFDPAGPGVAARPARAASALAVRAGAVWDHLIYAYLIENTRIYDVFLKVLQLYRTGELLGIPTRASQRFWRTTESLVYSDPPPTSIWSTTSRAAPDEVAQRHSKYWSLFGLDLDHAASLAAQHSYTKADSANTDFLSMFDSLAGEFWRILVNARNLVGANDSDEAAASIRAQRLNRMFAARRQHGNIAREEFRAVTVMSWLHLAISYDSPAVVDLGAAMGHGGSAADRLIRISDRVAKCTGDPSLTVHPAAQAMFDLARPLSLLLRVVENGGFDTIAGVNLLRFNPHMENLVRTVLALYPVAMGRNLKATPVTVVRPVPPQQQLVRSSPASRVASVVRPASVSN